MQPTKKTGPKPREPQMRRCSFTWFNYKPEDIEHIKALPASSIDYLVIGFEVCPTTQAPHLQGYAEFSSSLARTTIQSRLAKGAPIHIEATKKARIANITYCKKEETGDPAAILLHGKKWIEISHKEKKQGIREAYAVVASMTREDNASLTAIAAEFPEEALKHASGIKSLIEDAKMIKMKEDFKNTIRGEPRGWQLDFIENVIKQPVDDRIVWWIWESTGNIGKTWLAKYLMAYHEAIVISNGATRDIALAYNGEPILVFDLKRTSVEMVNYQVLESIKDGLVFSPKYNSHVKAFASPHVVCMANWPPEFGALSKDRWRIIDLNGPFAKQEVA